MTHLSLINNFGKLKDFTKPIPQRLLDIEDKKRSNLFAWRGQFSPQLVECLLEEYCSVGSVVLDPFAGSGTVLLEAAKVNLPAFGFEINPAAWSFSKLYEFSNLSPRFREQIISELRSKIEDEFPVLIFADPELTLGEVEARFFRIGESISDKAKVLCNALVVLLDIYNNESTSDLVLSKFFALSKLVRALPYSDEPIKIDLRDARSLPLPNQSIDFVLTSPPYINVFNYHQNYRRSVELLGWDVLRVARSEIGSNRANRGNRFYTVVQYCIDIARTLQELARVLRPDGRAIFIVGYESKVLGVPFRNAEIVQRIITELEMFDVVQHQHRVFKNRFGQLIREDVLNFIRQPYNHSEETPETIGRRVARDALESGMILVPAKNRPLLTNALSRTRTIQGIPLFNTTSYADYQTRTGVMMVKEGDEIVYE